MFVKAVNHTPDQALDAALLANAVPSVEISAYIALARQSETIVSYFWGRDLVAQVGFVALPALTNSGYIWMQDTPFTKQHPIAVGRVGILTLRAAFTRWSSIVGHCVAGTASIAWLRSLGAEFYPPIDDLIPFQINRAP